MVDSSIIDLQCTKLDYISVARREGKNHWMGRQTSSIGPKRYCWSHLKELP